MLSGGVEDVASRVVVVRAAGRWAKRSRCGQRTGRVRVRCRVAGRKLEAVVEWRACGLGARGQEGGGGVKLQAGRGSEAGEGRN